jgi:hypothetical protein
VCIMFTMFMNAIIKTDKRMPQHWRSFCTFICYFSFSRCRDFYIFIRFAEMTRKIPSEIWRQSYLFRPVSKKCFRTGKSIWIWGGINLTNTVICCLTLLIVLNLFIYNIQKPLSLSKEIINIWKKIYKLTLFLKGDFFFSNILRICQQTRKLRQSSESLPDFNAYTLNFLEICWTVLKKLKLTNFILKLLANFAIKTRWCVSICPFVDIRTKAGEKKVAL